MHDFFNRVRIVLISILLIFLISGFLVFPGGVINLAERIQDLESNVRIALAFVALIVDVILFVVIFQEIRARPLMSHGFVVRSRAANVEITLDSVRSNIDSQIAKLNDIFAVESQVKAEQGRVSVEMDVDAAEGIDVRKKTNEINREVKKVVDRQMGLKLGPKPVIRFELMREPAARSPRSESQPEPENQGGIRNLFKREKREQIPESAPLPRPPLMELPSTPDSESASKEEPYFVGSTNADNAESTEPNEQVS